MIETARTLFWVLIAIVTTIVFAYLQALRDKARKAPKDERLESGNAMKFVDAVEIVYELAMTNQGGYYNEYLAGNQAKVDEAFTAVSAYITVVKRLEANND